MKFVPRYQGERIPAGVLWWFVVEHGHVVRKVNLDRYTTFPALEDPNLYYIAYG